MACKDALEGEELQRAPQKRLDRRSEEVANSVEGGYRRLYMPFFLNLAFAVRETVTAHRLGGLEGRGGSPSSPSDGSLVS